MNTSKPVQLVLENGAVFEGKAFGYDKPTAGEVVFSTAMVGYPESLTDPSYAGQILTVTYPLIGNYGVPEDRIENQLSVFYESEIIHVKGLIISDYSFQYSHWNAKRSLDEWLKEQQIPGIYGVDTRELTKMLREVGSLKGRFVYPDQEDVPFLDADAVNWVAEVSCKEVLTYGSGRKKIVLVDCGVKHNIVRCLLKRDVTLYRVPWDYDYSQMEYDGLFISNGPGNPEHCQATIKHLKKSLNETKPIFGICMGNQLLSLAGGAKTYKLKYGHRSHNQPVQMVGTDRCFITSQNHGYAVDHTTMGSEWQPLFLNLNDETNEGVRHVSKPFFSAQFHPEASSGPTDTEFLFDDFLDLIQK